jgi:hypothetical protein
MILECSFCIDYISRVVDPSLRRSHRKMTAELQKARFYTQADYANHTKICPSKKENNAMSPLQINNVDDTDNQKEKKKKKPSPVGLTSADAETIKRVVELDQKNNI